MKISFLFILLIILLSLSCEKNDVFKNLESKPSGLYLLEIDGFGVPSLNTMDTLKWIEFKYNEKKYVEKINHYNLENRSIFASNIFFYNGKGQVYQIDTYFFQ